MKFKSKEIEAKMKRRLLTPIIFLALAGTILPPMRLAQSGSVQASFAGRCSNCWPGWLELARPVGGVGPSVRNGSAFIFTNGSNPDPLLNQEHLVFSGTGDTSIGAVREVSVQFSFSNAAIGGRLLFTDGSLSCVPQAQINSYVTEELLIITMRDNGSSWYGAFVGDFTLLDPSFVPALEVSERRIYTTVGLLQKTQAGFELLAIKVISQITRFSLVNSILRIDESDQTAPTLRAAFSFADGRSVTVSDEIEQELITSASKAGIIYLVGNGSPCTSLVQRQVAVHSFMMR